jgi:hypothetical protein
MSVTGVNDKNHKGDSFMNKIPRIITRAIYLLSIFLFSCDKKKNINSVEYSDTQIINLTIYRNFNYDPEDTKPDKNSPSQINGCIYATKLPKLMHIKSGDLYLVQGSGLSATYDENLLSIYGSCSRIPTSDFEISTSLGVVQGTVTEPYIRVKPSINFEDSLKRGQPIQLDWTGANADFFSINCVSSKEGSPSTTILDTVITDKKLTLPPSILEPAFEGDSSSVEIQVIAVNGPNDEPEIISNLSGDGSGFLYRFIVCRTIRLIIINKTAYPNKNSYDTNNDEIIIEHLIQKFFTSY